MDDICDKHLYLLDVLIEGLVPKVSELGSLNMN